MSCSSGTLTRNGRIASFIGGSPVGSAPAGRAQVSVPRWTAARVETPVPRNRRRFCLISSAIGESPPLEVGRKGLVIPSVRPGHTLRGQDWHIIKLLEAMDKQGGGVLLVSSRHLAKAIVDRCLE